MKTRLTAKQTYKKEFINGVYKTIAAKANTFLTKEDAKKIKDYAEKIDITKWYKEDKERVVNMLSYGTNKYQYTVNDATVDAWNKAEEWANTIRKRLRI